MLAGSEIFSLEMSKTEALTQAGSNSMQLKGACMNNWAWIFPASLAHILARRFEDPLVSEYERKPRSSKERQGRARVTVIVPTTFVTLKLAKPLLPLLSFFLLQASSTGARS